MAGEYIDPDDGAPDCRLCGDTGSFNGHPCNHRDSKRLGATAEVVGRFVAKNWDYANGRAI